MQIAGQSRAIHGLVGTHVRTVLAGSSCRYTRDRIGEGLDREAPHIALEDGRIRRRIDFVYPPVICLAEIEIRYSALGPQADINDERIILACETVIHLVTGCALTGIPRQAYVSGMNRLAIQA